MRKFDGSGRAAQHYSRLFGRRSPKARLPRRLGALLVLLLSVGAPVACGPAPDGSGSVSSPPSRMTSAHHEVTLAPPAPQRMKTSPLHPVVIPSARLPSPTAPTPPVPRGSTPIPGTGQQLDLKLLVISADGTETDYAAVTTFLRRIGIPFDSLIATQTPLVAGMLASGNHGFYQGVILATGDLEYYDTATVQWTSAFDDAEWSTLWDYERTFGVRQVTSYTSPYGPPSTYGLNLVTYQDTTTAPLSVQLTSAGQQVFPDLAPNGIFDIRYAWTYLATPTDATTTPLLTTTDGQYAIASVSNYADGRQNLTVTTANSPYLLHSMFFSYGIINWVTRGLFLGERHINMAPQVDDVLIEDDTWDVNALTDTTGLTYRISGSDYRALIAWDNQVRNRVPMLTLEFAFNGEGATGIYPSDTLTPAVKQRSAPFNWITHTYDHANLDAITYADTTTELQLNRKVANKTLALQNYDSTALVQPDVSGLYNLAFQAAAYDFGIRYVVSDTSQPGWDNPAPNEGQWSSIEPGLFIVPRRPDNLFYNVTTPEEWVSEYNHFYAPGGLIPYWDHDLSYAEILDFESDMWLRDLISWSDDPRMFHQSNLRAFDGVHSLLGSLIDATLDKYFRFYSLPVRYLRQSAIGGKMKDRMAYDASGAAGTLVAGATGCTLVLSTAQSATVPVTGVLTGPKTEIYGGQSVSYVTVRGGASVSISTACP